MQTVRGWFDKSAQEFFSLSASSFNKAPIIIILVLIADQNNLWLHYLQRFNHFKDNIANAAGATFKFSSHGLWIV